MTSLAQNGCAHFYHFTISVCFLVLSHKNDQHHNSDLCLVKSFQIQAKSCFFFFLLRVYLLPASRREGGNKKKNDGKICEIEICRRKPGGAALFYGSTCGLMFALLTLKESISARERLLAVQTKCPQRPQCIE